MNHKIWILMIFIVLNACNSIRRGGESQHGDGLCRKNIIQKGTRTSSHKDGLSRFSDSILTYPIGAKELATYPFPKDRFLVLDDSTKNNAVTREQQNALYRVWTYYLGLNPVCTDCNGYYFFLPEIDAIFPVILGNNESSSDTDYFQTWQKFGEPHALEDYTKRLQDIHGYEVYYYAETDAEIGGWVPFVKDLSAECCATRPFEINSTGVLIFYDRESRSAKVLRVHVVENWGDGMEYRFFYIDRGGRIRIYTGYGQRLKDQEREGKGWAYLLVKSFDIIVRQNGEIVVMEKVRKKNSD